MRELSVISMVRRTARAGFPVYRRHSRRKNADLGILGKSAGKDVAAKKATYPAVIGLEKSRAEAKRLTREAHNALSIFSDRDAEALHALANYLLEREY